MSININPMLESAKDEAGLWDQKRTKIYMELEKACDELMDNVKPNGSYPSFITTPAITETIMGIKVTREMDRDRGRGSVDFARLIIAERDPKNDKTVALEIKDNDKWKEIMASTPEEAMRELINVFAYRSLLKGQPDLS